MSIRHVKLAVLLLTVSMSCSGETANEWLSRLKAATGEEKFAIGLQYSKLTPGLETESALRNCLRSSDAIERAYCTAAIGELSDNQDADAELLIKLLSDDDSLVRAHAVVALSKFDDNVIPILLDELKRTYRVGLLSLPPDHLLVHSGEFLGSVPALLAATALGQHPASVNPVLKLLIDLPENSPTAGTLKPKPILVPYLDFILRRIGSPCASRIIAELGHSSPAAQLRLLTVLAYPEVSAGIRTQAPALAPYLVLHDSKAAVLVSEALANSGSWGQRVIERAIQTNDAESILNVIARLPPESIDFIVELTRSKSVDVRIQAFSSLGNLIPSKTDEHWAPASAFSAAVAALQDSSPEIRGLAYKVTLDFPPRSLESLPDDSVHEPLVHLSSLLSSDATALMALRAVSVLGTSASSLRGQVSRLLGEVDPNSVLDTLESIGPDAGAISAVETFYASAKVGKLKAARLLITWGRPAEPYLIYIKSLFDSGNRDDPYSLENPATVLMLAGSEGMDVLHEECEIEVESAASLWPRESAPFELARLSQRAEDTECITKGLQGKGELERFVVSGLAQRRTPLSGSQDVLDNIGRELAKQLDDGYDESIVEALPKLGVSSVPALASLAKHLDRINDDDMEGAQRAFAIAPTRSAGMLTQVIYDHRKGTSEFDIETWHTAFELLIGLKLDGRDRLNAFTFLQKEPASDWLLSVLDKLPAEPALLRLSISELLVDSNNRLRDKAIDTVDELSLGAESKEAASMALNSFTLHFASDAQYRFEHDIYRDFPEVLASTGNPPAPFSATRPPKQSEFGWPVPFPSDKENITELFRPGESIRQVDERLRRALEEGGYGAGGLFKAPNGFIRVARLEQIGEDRSPVLGGYRFLDTHVPPQNFFDYVEQFFLAKPGLFRLIVFVVTTHLEWDPSLRLNRTAAGTLFLNGSDDPRDVPDGTLGDYQIYALIYEFQKAHSETDQVIPSPKSARFHLISCGLWRELGGR